MRWIAWIREYFTFTRKERIGLLAIVLLILLIWIFPQVVKPTQQQKVLRDTAWITAAKTLQQKEVNPKPDSKTNDETPDEFVYDKSANAQSATPKGELFYFDPNTLTTSGWEKLGIQERTIQVIQNYLNKGGHFYKPEDLKKIYGIHPDQFARLAPYIEIEMATRKDAGYLKPDLRTDRRESSVSKILIVEINSADTSAFIALPGIGSKLAVRIINFRDKLGGFYTVDQVSETFGLPDSTFTKIKPMLRCESPSVRKININAATKDEMRSHPYFRWNLANAIVEYRNQHGNFSSVEDLKKIGAITDNVFEKLKPYITTQ